MITASLNLIHLVFLIIIHDFTHLKIHLCSGWFYNKKIILSHLYIIPPNQCIIREELLLHIYFGLDFFRIAKGARRATVVATATVVAGTTATAAAGIAKSDKEFIMAAKDPTDQQTINEIHKLNHTKHNNISGLCTGLCI